jgi:fibronectin-binding autotransporter adhesin
MWKSWKFGSGRRASARPRRVRPCLEALEDRLCPAPLMVTTLNDPASPQANDGSLRGELLQNVMDGGGDTIQFAAGLNGTINLNSTLTNGGKSVTIANPNGDNITISGQGAVEDLSLTGGTGTNVSITGQSTGGTGSLIFTGGRSSNGAGISVAAGTTVTLSNLNVSGNTAININGIGGETLGGGIDNHGILQLTNVNVTGNQVLVEETSTSTAAGGGIANEAGAQLTITGGQVSDNIASNTSTNSPANLDSVDGGGIWDEGSLLSITGTSITGNSAVSTNSGGTGVAGGGVFSDGDTSVIITNTTIGGSGTAGNLVSTSDGNAVGGGIAFGSGFLVSVAGKAILNDVNITGNIAEANPGAGYAKGGGLYAPPSSIVTLSGNVTDNQAIDNVAADPAEGGGIYDNGGTLTVNANGSTASNISGNTASTTDGGTAYGGAVFASGTATLTLTDVELTGNTATATGASPGAAVGGGLAIRGGELNLADSTVAFNTATSAATGSGLNAAGGGISFSTSAATAVLTNDTIGNNSATASGTSAAQGGGIWAVAGATTLIEVTVAGNTATAGTGKGGGIYQSNTATLNLVNSIVSDPNGPAGSPDVFGTVANAQNDDFASTTGLTITHDLGGNLLNVVPLLGPLGNNGGPTQTVAELAGSGSIDAGVANAGVNAVFGTNPIPDTDQRGAARPDVPGSNPDIGAFEFYPPTPTHTSAPTTITGLSVSDSFGAFNQTETVKGQVVAGGMPVSGGTVTVSDGGETQTVGVNSSGNFSATFVFNLFQEFSTAAAHPISVSYGGATVGSTTFGSSSGSVGAPNNSLSFLFEILLLEDILAAMGMG